MNRRYLVTGGAGNLARQLVPLLDEAGAQLTLFDRADAGLGSPTVACVAGDIADTASLRALFARVRPTHILHLASLLSGSSEQDRNAAWRINAGASFELLELSREFAVEQFFFPSTSLTYGRGLPNPVPEDFPQWPDTLYGATKVAVERLGAYYQARHGLDFRSFRMPLVISPYAPPAAMTAYGSHVFIAAAKGQASFTFPVAPEVRVSAIYVKDVLRGMKTFIDAPARQLSRRVYNLHSLSPSAGDLAAVVQRHVSGFSCTFAPDPAIMRIAPEWPARFDDTAARRDWNWNPVFDLERMTVDFLEEIRKSIQKESPSTPKEN
jgi:threonine 3-dehydrogenase